MQVSSLMFDNVWRIFSVALLCAASEVSASDVTNVLASNSIIASRRATSIDANEAARRLRQAQLKRKHGTEPLPGEQDRGSGAGVVNHRYWLRQDKLRNVVEQAQRRSNETRQLLLAHR